jgi:cytoskeleton protein RodZ
VWPEDAPAAPGAVSTEPEAVEATPEPESEPVQEAAVPEAPTVATPAGSAEGGARIEVRALSDSWIQIRDGVARRLLVTRLLRAGDTYVVPDQPGLTLLTGNAGALEILVDGQTVEPIGEEGAVRRNVVLNADRLLAGTAVVD